MTEIELKITGLTALGNGVGRVDNRAIFVDNVCTGDFVRARITKEKKRFAFAELLEVLEPSPFRDEPVCKHFSECGGCVWQHVKYEQQLKEKSQILKSNLLRIGGFDCKDIETIGTDSGYGYRIKTRLQIGENGKSGFFAKSSNRLVEIENCPILNPELNCAQKKLRNILKPVLSKAGVEKGYLEVGYSPVDKQVAFKLVCDKPISEDSLKKHFKGDEQICGFVYGENENEIRFGKTALKISEDENGLAVKHEIDSFWQTNFELNGKVKLILNRLLDEIAAKSENEEMKAVELFSGSGNYTQNIARYFYEINVVESDTLACESLMKNLKSVKGKIRLTNLNADKGIVSLNNQKTDFLFLDPPRSGFANGMKKICEMKPEWLAYLSCDNATFARDLKVLRENGYDVETVYCLDFFPQTFHIETFCIMRHI